MDRDSGDGHCSGVGVRADTTEGLALSYDAFLFWVWVLMAALFWFSTVYSLLLFWAIRNAVNSQLFWTFLPIAVAMSINAFVRSGQTSFDTTHIQVLYRTMMLMSAFNSVIVVVAVGLSYNGKLSWRREVELLKDKLGMGVGNDNPTA